MDEADEQPSNEYARADDDDLGAADDDEAVGCGTREMVNGSDEEEFTYSYGDVLSAAAAAVGPGGVGGSVTGTRSLVEEVKLETSEAIIAKTAALPPPPPQTVHVAKPVQTIDADSSSLPGSTTLNKLAFDVLKLNIHRLPGEISDFNLDDFCL